MLQSPGEGPLTPAAYRAFLRIAQRHSRRADEADDLLQDALLAAVAAGRADFARAENRRWLAGVIRNRAAFTARTVARRARRETGWQAATHRPSDAPVPPDDFGAILRELPPALKAVAALALSGHSRREIGYLLRLPDTALRQRIAALRRRFGAFGLALPIGTPGLNLDLAYGRIRDALLPLLIAQKGTLASHDPDGHLFVVRNAHKEESGGN